MDPNTHKGLTCAVRKWQSRQNMVANTADNVMRGLAYLGALVVDLKKLDLTAE
jgi:hypothetical protein